MTPMSSPVVRVAAVALILAIFACESPEDRLAGRYVRTWKEGVTPELGLHGEPDRLVLVLTADQRWTTEHPDTTLQQFDVPLGQGTWALNGVTLTIQPTDLGPMQYTVSGDTLFPRTPPRARQAESMMGMKMNIGLNTYLLRER
jgi:hypothetical protein